MRARARRLEGAEGAMATAIEKLELAKKHLKKVQGAWNPPEWADLALYGFYCLEAAVDAAAIHHGVAVKAEHRDRVRAAETLHSKHGLPDIADLLRELNTLRKSEAYGDIEAPEMDPERIATEVEEYVEAVSNRIRSRRKDTDS